MLSSTNFIDLAFIFKAITYFELIYVYGVTERLKSFFFVAFSMQLLIPINLFLYQLIKDYPFSIELSRTFW